MTTLEPPRLEQQLERLALPRSAARVLAACATSRSLCGELPLHDPLAERVFDYLGGRAEDFDERELRATAFRAHVLDELTRERLSVLPPTLGVGVWPVLGTRGHRVKAERWVDVDAPPVAEVRRQLLPERRGWLQLSSCLCSAHWLHAVAGQQGRNLLMVLDESVLPLPARAMMHFLDGVSAHASSGSELLVCFDAEARLRSSLPLSKRSALELLLPEGSVARYPRLRLVSPDEYSPPLRTRVEGVNAIAALRGGVGAPALIHVRVA